MLVVTREQYIIIARIKRLIREKSGRELTTHEVLEKARPVYSLFHKYFTWTDDDAARLARARRINLAMNAYAMQIYFLHK
jgi:hypothetical protein